MTDAEKRVLVDRLRNIKKVLALLSCGLLYPARHISAIEEAADEIERSIGR